MLHEHIHFFKASFIKEHGYTFTCSVLSFIMLLVDGFRASTQTSLRTKLYQFFYFFKLVTHGISLYMDKIKMRFLSQLFLAEFGQYSHG